MEVHSRAPGEAQRELISRLPTTEGEARVTGTEQYSVQNVSSTDE